MVLYITFKISNYVLLYKISIPLISSLLFAAAYNSRRGMNNLKSIRSFFSALPSAKKFKSDVEHISNLEAGITSDTKITPVMSEKENDIPNHSSETVQAPVEVASDLVTPSSSTMDLFMDLEHGWKTALIQQNKLSYYRNLMSYLDKEMTTTIVYPPRNEIFTAFQLCPYDNVKVVIVGQDPYHGPGQAHGLAFSVKHGVQPPPSLKNIFKEAKEDVGMRIPNHGCLQDWAKQGVFLLNTCLTVRNGVANSHQGQGWEQFTDAVIRELDRKESLVFILWGNPAQKKCASIDSKRHHIIKSSHPSPLGAAKTSQPFLGSRCFSRCNSALIAMGKSPIDWTIS